MDALAAECRSCGAPVLFTESARTGKAMILDREPRADGNVTLDGDGLATVHGGPALHPGQGTLVAAPPPLRPRYVDHHESCPHARTWRRKRDRPVGVPLGGGA